MRTPTMPHDVLAHARQALVSQQATIGLLAEQLNATFLEAVALLAGTGKTITTGLGKSGFIARKMAATLNSVRLPSVYLHPVDALHGDSGFIERGDTLVAFSKSGETPEVTRFVETAVSLGVKVVCIVARSGSSLADVSHVSLVAPVEREFDPENLLPTASTTSALVLADLLAVCAAMYAGDMVERLQHSHPSGAIGAAVLRTVEDVMHSGPSLPVVAPGTAMRHALDVLSEAALGIVCVCNADHELLGILTDGDVRRWVGEGNADVDTVTIDQVMITTPVTVSAGASVHQATLLMERRERQINVLPVVDHGTCVGVVRLHDLVRLQM